MRGVRSMVDAARRRAAARISPDTQRAPASHYYPQQPSCQIPHMWFLLEHFLGRREHGWFVEVGAFDGKRISNTWGLAVRDWTGLLVEPSPKYAAMARRNHRQHPRIEVVELAVSETDGQTIRLQLAGPLTSANPTAFSEYRDVPWAAGSLTDDEVHVRTITLDTLLAEKSVPVGFDALFVDVEGFEEQVFAGFDLAHWRPKMLVVELSDLRPDLTATRAGHAALSRSLLACGYSIAAKDEVNTVLVRDDLWS